MISQSDYIGRAVAALRRVSDDLEKSDTRRLFRPLGLPVDVDLNKVSAFLFRSLAAGILAKQRHTSRTQRKGSQRGRGA